MVFKLFQLTNLMRLLTLSPFHVNEGRGQDAIGSIDTLVDRLFHYIGGKELHNVLLPYLNQILLLSLMVNCTYNRCLEIILLNTIHFLQDILHLFSSSADEHNRSAGQVVYFYF